ncbi:MAG TPA: lipoyl(octanoyl) transferase LipB [Halothiobacillus sp.]|nr:lipoyl(octanoyl) transferase LipB [Halothiobacillus sp.]
MSIKVRRLGVNQLYESIVQAMRDFARARVATTPDEIWLLEHSPVYSMGLNADASHLLSPGEIPVVQSDRGGQVTYHGPGQLVMYTLIDLSRYKLGVREYVHLLEQQVIDLLAEYGIAGERRESAPGVYVDGAKIASLGLKVRQGRCYHGLSLNVDMDLTPFSFINPCGYAGLRVCQLADFVPGVEVDSVAEMLSSSLIRSLEDQP